MRKSVISLLLAPSAIAGPFAPAAGNPGSDAIPAADPRFLVWASTATVERGPTEIGYEGSSSATYGQDEAATGPADATPAFPYPVVSLGDGGTATMEFAQPFADAPGPDLAVFENGFIPTFLELAHVEVSSDGVHYFRFPSTSLTPASANLGEGGAVDPTDVHHLAGKHIAGFGTPFDLAALRNVSPLLDVQRITHVRVIDAVGTNDPALASRDASGNLVIDPYPTPYHSSGFDLDAVGAFIPTPVTFAAWQAANGSANLIAYLTGNSRLDLQHSGQQITLRFQRLSYRTDASLRLEGSDDLRSWTRIAESVHGGGMVPHAPGVSVVETGSMAKTTAITLGTAPFRFFRLAAEP
jgi:hypothetical protein